MTKILNKIKKLFKRNKMTDFERYLSEAVDVADLENRMKYGYKNKNFNSTSIESVRSNSLFYVRGF